MADLERVLGSGASTPLSTHAILIPRSPISPPLRNLRRLDISDLPAVSSPDLTQILVEEMLPNCEVRGSDWAQGLKLGLEEQSRDPASSPVPA